MVQNTWTPVLYFECIVLQGTLHGRYFTAGGNFYFSLNRVL